MLRKTKIGVCVSILVIGLMFLGGCGHNTPEAIADKIVDDITTKLELNSAQQQQLQMIKAELLVKMAEMKKAKQSMHEEVLTELQKDVLDQNNLKKMFNTCKVGMEDISNIAIARLAQFHKTLNPEQKKKLVEYLKDKEKCNRRCPLSR